MVRRSGPKPDAVPASAHVGVLLAGARTWNAWRQESPGVVPILNDLRVSVSERQFGPVQGGPINLSRAELRRAQLDQATLIEANLMGAVLSEADLSEARLDNADLRGAKLAHAVLRGARLDGANLCGADLRLAKGVTQAQVDRALGDRRTALPAGLFTPKAWLREELLGLGQLVAPSGRGAAAPDDSADPYAILGVGRGTSLPDIRVAWLRLVKELHPDGASGEPPDRLKAINQAYQELKDQERRGNETRAGFFRGFKAAFVICLATTVVVGLLIAVAESYLPRTGAGPERASAGSVHPRTQPAAADTAQPPMPR